MKGNKLGISRTHTYVLQVSGPCPFPIDMLRYDACWPAQERDASEIAQTLNPMLDNKPYVVRVMKYDTTHVIWTINRWESFHCEVQEVDYNEPR